MVFLLLLSCQIAYDIVCGLRQRKGLSKDVPKIEDFLDKL